jgi:hypothetical protein
VALPDDLNTVTVTGTYLALDKPCTGEISFSVSQVLVDDDGDVAFLPVASRRQLDLNGSFSIELPATDNELLAPDGWYYVVVERIDRFRSSTRYLKVPADLGPTVDINDTVTVNPGAQVTTYVNSVDGLTGDVDLTTRYVRLGNDGKVLTSQMPAPAVASVNGHTGTVVLVSSDVGAIPDALRGAISGVAQLDGAGKVPAAQSRVVSVDGLSGVVSLTASYLAASARGANNGVASLDSGGKVPTSQLPASGGAVSSVNGQTGTVELVAADVNAIASTARGSASGVASLDGSSLVPTSQIPDLDGAKIASGTVAFARLPTGTGGSQVAIGNHTHAYVPTSSLGANSGVATLDSGGKVTSGQLPTYVTTVNGQSGAAVLSQSIPFGYTGIISILTGTVPYHNDTGRTLVISKVRASVGTAPVGAGIRVDVNKNGSSIFSGTGAQPTIADGTTTATATPTTTSWADGESLKIDIDTVGSSTPGSDLVVLVTVS